MKKPRPAWLEKKIRDEQHARDKKDPELSTKMREYRRQKWLLDREFRAIVQK